jgi:hypothetical protein
MLKRSYSLSTSEDVAAASNHICPDYALHWSLENNKNYWPEGHDFLTPYEGYVPSKPFYSDLRNIQLDFFQDKTKKIVYCDLDGVLANFDKGVYNLLGRHPDEIDKVKLWININKCVDFFSNLEWLPEGRQLWNALLE